MRRDALVCGTLNRSYDRGHFFNWVQGLFYNIKRLRFSITNPLV